MPDKTHNGYALSTNHRVNIIKTKQQHGGQHQKIPSHVLLTPGSHESKETFMSKLQKGESRDVFKCLIFFRQTCALSRTKSTLSFLFFLLEKCFITSLLGVSSSELPVVSPSITTLSAEAGSKPQSLLFLCPSRLVDSVSHEKQYISKTIYII